MLSQRKGIPFFSLAGKKKNLNNYYILSFLQKKVKFCFLIIWNYIHNFLVFLLLFLLLVCLFTFWRTKPKILLSGSLQKQPGDLGSGHQFPNHFASYITENFLTISLSSPFPSHSCLEGLFIVTRPFKMRFVPIPTCYLDVLFKRLCHHITLLYKINWKNDEKSVVQDKTKDSMT